MFLVAIGFVPVGYFSVKEEFLGIVWMAYPGYFIMGGGSLWLLAFFILVIVAHIGLSIGCAIVFDRLFFGKIH
jgi:hypothetical protein